MSLRNPSLGGDFFVAGGTLAPGHVSYVERKADTDLFNAICAGEFCYVLTSRQMGKSSLFSRVASRLRSDGFRVSIVDLQSIGINVSIEQWFDGMLERIGSDFDLEDEIDDFREENPELGALQTWLEVIRRVLLVRIPGRVVIVIDEIDLVRSIQGFSTDDLFLGIRDLYNRRGDDPEMKRLTFCLLGVASPGDLIQNKDVTPFNIGRRIELQDFTEQEMLKLAAGITHVDQEQARKLIHRVYYWTGGQPYLTQKLCQGVAQDTSILTAEDLDQLVARLFLNQHSTETESHFIFIRERLLAQRRLDPVGFQRTLDLYGKILKGRSVRDSEVSEEVTRLKLSGLVRGENGVLLVKNPIYHRNFGIPWVRAQLPRQLDWKMAIDYAGTAFRYSLPVFLICVLFAYFTLYVDISHERAKVGSEFASLYSLKISQAWRSEYRCVKAAFYKQQVTDGRDLGVKVDPKQLILKEDIDKNRVYESRFEPAGTFDLGWSSKVDQAEVVPMNFPGHPEIGMLFVLRSKDDPDERNGDLRFLFWNGATRSTSQKEPTAPIESSNATAFAYCGPKHLVAVNFFSGSSLNGTKTNKLKIVEISSLTDLNRALENDDDALPLDLSQPRSTAQGNVFSTIARVSKLGFSRDGRYLAVGFDSGEVALVTLKGDIRCGDNSTTEVRNVQRNWWTVVNSSEKFTEKSFHKAADESSDEEADKSFYNASVASSSKSIDSLSFLGGGSILLAGSAGREWSFDHTGVPSSALTGPVAVSPDNWSHLLKDASASDAFFLRTDSTSISNYSSSNLIDNTRLGLGATPTAFAFSPNGTTFIIGQDDGSVCLGNSQGIEETIPALAKPVLAIAFSPDGKSLTAVGLSGMVRVWRLSDQPIPVISDTETLADAATRWQVVYDEASLDFRAQPKANTAWQKVSFRHDTADDYDKFWSFSSYLDSLMDSLSTNLADEGVRKEVNAYLDRAIEAGKSLNLDDTQQDPQRNQFLLYQTLKSYLNQKNPPTLNDLQNLPEAERWLVLELRMDDWKPNLSSKNSKDLSLFQLEHARVIGDRCQALAKFWESKGLWENDFGPMTNQMNVAVDLVQNSFKSGITSKAAYSNMPNILTNDPRLKPIFDSLNELYQLDDQLTSALDGGQENRDIALDRFEKFKGKQSSLAFGVMLHAAENYDLSGKYRQAEECYDSASTVANSEEEQARSLFEQSFLAENREDDPQRVLDLARQATVLDPGSTEYWERRYNLEIRADPVSGIFTFVDLPHTFNNAVHDRTQAIATLKALKKTDSTATNKLLYLQLGGIYAAVGNSEEAQRKYDKVLRQDQSLKTWKLFWKYRSNETEDQEKWWFEAISQSIRENTPKLQKEDGQALSDDDKEALLWLLSRRAYYYCEKNMLPKAIADFNLVLRNNPSDEVKGRTLLRLAVALSYLGLNTEAEQAFTAGQPLDSDYYDYDHFTYGRLLEGEGKVDQATGDTTTVDNATKEYRLAYLPDPSNQQIKSYRFLPFLAATLASTGHGPDALDLIGKAAASKGDQADPLPNPQPMDLIVKIVASTKTHADKISILQALAYTLRLQELNMQKVRPSPSDDAVKLNNAALAAMAKAQEIMKEQQPPPHLALADAALFLGDISTARNEVNLYCVDFPSDQVQSLILKARIEMADTSKPGGIDRALGKLARLASMEYYNVQYLALADIDAAKFKNLPHWDELVVAARLSESGVQDLGPRDLRLAEWMEKLPVTDPEAKMDIMESAKACRDLAKQYTDAPLDLPPLP